MTGAAPLRIQLNWEEPVTGERRSPILTVPIALGREFAQMPAQLGEQRVCRIALASDEISRFHALIIWETDGLVVTDQSSINGTLVNGVLRHRSFLANGDTIQIGPYAIAISFAVNSPAPVSPAAPLLAETQPPDPHFAITEMPNPEADNFLSSADVSFLPALFQNPQVSVQDLFATGLPVRETDYAAIGAGLGSFCWVDLLRICGVHAAQIVALGMEPQPYARYQQLCRNSQIPLHERLRSASDACPDNIWGWSSYALREAGHDLRKGRISTALKYLWQVFAEPTFAETYTPRASNVFASLDREAKRIGWEEMFCDGQVQGIRKTNDGRYAIAYCSTSQPRDRAFLVARYVQLATGSPAIQFLPDLQAYREQTKDFKSVVNAHENHDHVYQHLEQQGGTVLIRGRGIVASRIVQRLYEARQKNHQIAILHLMRSPKTQGSKFGLAQRHVENHYEFQPFDWPKACWSGELRAMLEQADPQERQRLLSIWGGTTTADRGDWRRIVEEGLSQGWYQITFGEVERVEPDERDRPITYIQEQNLKGQMRLEADFVIDATGLEAQVKTNPLLDDLVTQYSLPLNPLGRLSVANDFELVEMRNGRGRLYAAGAMTLGGPYAAVDSFLGLQYAALCSMADLAKMRAPSLQRLHPVQSLTQWLKWVLGQSPS